MKRKIDLTAITPKGGLLAAVAMILTGGVATLFFGLALVGVAVTPDIIGHLVPAIVTVILFGGSVLLLRRGMRRLKQYRSGRACDDSNRAVTEQPTPVTVTVSNQHPVSEQAVRCESCGAIAPADENGCCEYCGSELKK